VSGRVLGEGGLNGGPVCACLQLKGILAAIKVFLQLKERFREREMFNLKYSMLSHVCLSPSLSLSFPHIGK
jgi:hypothetical protein